MFYAEKKYDASIRLYELKDKNVKGRETLWDEQIIIYFLSSGHLGIWGS